MTKAIATKKLTSLGVRVNLDVGEPRCAGPKGRLLTNETLSPLKTSKSNLDVGYKAMATDKEREQQATEWVAALTGETIKDRAC